MIEIIGDLALLGVALALLVAFSYMYITGSFTAIESSPWRFWLEIGLFIAIICLSVNRLLDDLHKG